MKKYRIVELKITPGSPCFGCKLENEEKIIGSQGPRKRVLEDLIDVCENCKKREAYFVYTKMVEYRVPNAGSSFDANLIKPQRRTPYDSED
jgi:hypothetical protein